MSAAYDIEFHGVTVQLGERTVLDDINLRVSHGSFWGIIGPNGAGKSTLVKTVLGLLPIHKGTIRLFGNDIVNNPQLRTRIGYVPQHSRIDLYFPLTVLEVVMTGTYGKLGLFKRPGKKERDDAIAALARVEMTDLADRRIGQLSGGQFQRVLIARALSVNPDLLILDEPTAALDVEAAESFYEWLNKLHSDLGSTILLISHDIGVVSMYVDSVACLNVWLVAHGRPTDVFNTDTLESMYGCGAVLFHHGEVPHMVVEHPKHRR
jgi:ABC-type Mn2+/Zn2+ transport system ATPase subunit